MSLTYKIEILEEENRQMFELIENVAYCRSKTGIGIKYFMEKRQ